MHFTKLVSSSIVAVGLLLHGADALVVKRCVGNGYGTLYNDHACRDGASVAFSLGNAGCLANQNGRNSVYVQTSCGLDHSMVWSPGPDCNCQNDCAHVPGTQGCWDLNGRKGASSFRFIEGECGPNNC